ncbi:MAG: hypothetical protein ABI684_09355 [Nitrospirota bacterium]
MRPDPIVCLLLLASMSVSAQEEAGSVPASEWKLAAPMPRGAEEVVGISARGKFYVLRGPVSNDYSSSVARAAWK